MSEEKNNGCLKAFMIFCVLNVLLLGAIGAGWYVLWKKNGSPSMETLQAMIAEKQGVQFGDEAELEEAEEAEASNAAPSSSRPIVATAPIQGNATNYKSYTTRKDVLTLVNYYTDT